MSRSVSVLLLDNLGELLLENICSFLPQGDVVTLREVCSRFRDVIDRRHGFSVVLYTNRTKDILRRVMELRIKELVLALFSDSLSSAISTISPSSTFPLRYPEVVRTLEITSGKRVPMEIYDTMMNTLTSLEELNLFGPALMSDRLDINEDDVDRYGRQYAAYGSIKKLGLLHNFLFKDHNYTIRENMMRILSCNFQQLEYLRMEYNRLKTNDGIFPLYQKVIEFVGRHKSSMKKLALVVEENSPPEGHNSANARAARARELDDPIEIVNMRLLRTECLKSLKMVKLKSISIVLDRSTDIDFWADMLTTQKELTTINFGFGINDPDKIKSMVEAVVSSNADTLENVSLSGLPFNSEPAPFDLAVFAGLSNLKSLLLKRRREGQVPAGLLNMNRLPKQIECIRFHKCSFMTHDFHDMLEGMTNLKEVVVLKEPTDGNGGLTFKNVNSIFKNNRKIFSVDCDILHTDIEEDIAEYENIAQEFDIEERLGEFEGERRLAKIRYQR